MNDSLGARIAKHRARLGWTQQELADRVGISRTALSHLEAGMKDAGERTVTLLAGVFKLEPHELVADTTYPPAKAERLPVVAARYTETEHLLALLGAEQELTGDLSAERRRHWRDRLDEQRARSHDRGEVERLTAAVRRLDRS